MKLHRRSPGRALASIISRRVAVLLGVHSALLASAAQAAVIQSEAFVQTNQQLCGPGPAPICINSVVYEQYQSASSVTTGSLDVQVTGGSGASWAGEIAANAAAELSTSKLRGRLLASDIAAGSYAFGLMNASIGDTFTVSTAGTSTFHIDLTGALAHTGTTGLFGSLAIQLFQPGAFDRWYAGDYAGMYDLAIDSASLMINQDIALPGSLTLSTDLPAGTFEWRVSIWSTYAFRQDAAQSNSLDLDLGHTAKVSYAGPDGALVTSASGFMPTAIHAVPEPGTHMLAVLGIALFGVTRRGSSIGKSGAVALPAWLMKPKNRPRRARAAHAS